jgi:nitrogen fixation-related uncharacterized protein
MTKQSNDSELETPGAKRLRTGFHMFFITICVAAGGMFIFKLFSFMKTIKREEMDGFAFDPIMIYALVAMGFLTLLVWAYLTGQFRDIEGPKYEMLERFHEQEQEEVRMTKGERKA